MTTLIGILVFVIIVVSGPLIIYLAVRTRNKKNAVKDVIVLQIAQRTNRYEPFIQKCLQKL